MPVAFERGAAAFVNGPHHEALATPAVATGKDARDVRMVFLELGFGVAARIAFDAERLQQRLLWSEEAHGEQLFHVQAELTLAGLCGRAM